MSSKTSKSPSKKAPATRTRKQVTEDFDELKTEVARLEAVDPKTKARIQARQGEIAEKYAKVALDDVIPSLSKLSLAVGRGIGEVQEQITASVTELQEVREAVVLEKERLVELHQKDLAAIALDVLIQEHEEKTAELEAAHEERTRELDADWAQKTAAIEKRRVDLVTALEAEKQRLSLEQTRNQEQWNYTEQQRQQRVRDEFAQKQAKLEADLALLKETTLREHGHREAALKAAEAELVELRNLRDAMPARLAATERSAQESTAAAVTNRLRAEFALQAKEQEKSLALLAQEKGMLTAQVADLQRQLVARDEKLAEAQKAVSDMALASFKEAGASRTLDQIQSLQARDNSNGQPRARG